MTAMEIIRLTGGEFKNVDDAIIEKMMEIVRPMVSRKQFGKLYEQGLAYLVCHKLKMAGFGESSNLAADAELGLTVYGVQFLQLRRSVIVPIHCSGESEVE